MRHPGVEEAVAAAVAAAPTEVVDDMRATAAVAAEHGFDLAAFREAGLIRSPAGGRPTLLLRGVVFGLLTPEDRPVFRRSSYRAVLAAHGDDVTAVVAMAVAVICADLSRGHEPSAALARCRQTLLEEAPLAVLDALAGSPPMAPDPPAVSALRAAVLALSGGPAPDDSLAAALAAAFAATRAASLASG